MPWKYFLFCYAIRPTDSPGKAIYRPHGKIEGKKQPKQKQMAIFKAFDMGKITVDNFNNIRRN